jgi:hypothetical protein
MNCNPGAGPVYISAGDFLYWSMAKLDLTLFIAFGVLSCAGVAGAILSFRQAMRVSGEKDGDLKMFLWAAVTMVSLITAGLSIAYILLPILFHY